MDGEYKYARQKYAYGKLGKLEIVLVTSMGHDNKEMVHSFCCAGGQVQPASDFVFYGKVPMLSHAEVIQETTMGKEAFKAGLEVDLKCDTFGKPQNDEIRATICHTVRRWLKVALTYGNIREVPKDIGVMFLPHLHTACVMVGPFSLSDWIDENWVEPGVLRFKIPSYADRYELLKKIHKRKGNGVPNDN